MAKKRLIEFGKSNKFLYNEDENGKENLLKEDPFDKYSGGKPVASMTIEEAEKVLKKSRKKS